MEIIDYSVVIRTTGKAREKYVRLLNSVKQLIPIPTEIIVVLPDGYSLPLERLGTEKFYFSKKGMYYQRIEGIKRCKTKYALICDDDVCFDSDFVKKLHKPLLQKKGFISAAPLFSFLPENTKGVISDAITASAVPTLLYRNKRYVTVLSSSGYSYNKHIDTNHEKYYESQSVAGTCFYADVETLKKCDLDAEVWLDFHGYAAIEDQLLIYKAWLNDYKTIVVSNAYYQHLDGKTSSKNNSKNMTYSLGFNRVVFWHRFLYNEKKHFISKFWVRLCFIYNTFCRLSISFIRGLTKGNNLDLFRLLKKGYRDGYKFLKTKEYKKLPEVVGK